MNDNDKNRKEMKYLKEFRQRMIQRSIKKWKGKERKPSRRGAGRS